MNLNELAQTVHTANAKWWQNIDTGEPIKRNKGELLALVHSELSEMADGEIDGKMDDKLPSRKMAEVEAIDAIIRLLDYAAGFGHNLQPKSARLCISEFEDLNAIGGLVPTDVWNFLDEGILFLHSCVSDILEFERKGKSDLAADAIVSCITAIAVYAADQAYDLQTVFDLKMAFNRDREDHKHEARRIAGGKQF